MDALDGFYGKSLHVYAYARAHIENHSGNASNPSIRPRCENHTIRCSIRTTMSATTIELLGYLATVALPAAWLLWENRR